MENRITEQASAYDDLQRMSVHDILTGINREDARVHEAVRTTIPVMERLVERIVERMECGGRMFYIGAGTSGRLAVTDASELPPTYGVPFDRVIGLIAGATGLCGGPWSMPRTTWKVRGAIWRLTPRPGRTC